MQLTDQVNPEIESLREDLNLQLANILPTIIRNETGKQVNQKGDISYSQEFINDAGEAITFEISFHNTKGNKTKAPPKAMTGRIPLYKASKRTGIFITKRTAEDQTAREQQRKNPNRVHISFLANVGEPEFFFFKDYDNNFHPDTRIGVKPHGREYERMLERAIELLTEFSELQYQYVRYQDDL